VYRRERPDLVHHIALKPTLYGSIAARATRTSAYVNTVAGLGYVFTSREIKARILGPVMRFAFRRLLNNPNSHLILQNPDDRDVLERYCNVRPERTYLIRGSGVDMAEFTPAPEPDGTPNVMMVSRMLWSKGVGELVDAASRLKEAGRPIRVTLVGAPDPENPASIPERQLKKWEALGLVEWLGHRTDVRDLWRVASIAVLPTTYGEGVPKALIEAAACARPIVATDVPGCREIVVDGETGILVPPKDTDALLDAIKRLADDGSLRKSMGEKGRAHAAEGFSEEAVIESTLACYDSLLTKGKGR
jgi:glycosyltransferase involved in cell wall biosynthesis